MLESESNYRTDVSRADCSRTCSVLLILLLVSIVALSGCGKGISTYPVTGKVHFPDGSPLPGGVVIFVSSETGTQSKAKTAQDGSFALGTFAESDGAVAGEHRVSVRPEITGFGAPPKHPILRKYQAATTSGLVFTVKPDEPNEFDIVVERDTSRRSTAALPDR